MSRILAPNEVGLALKLAGLSPFALDTRVFQIVHGGENYVVYTDRLPEIYVEKTVPLDLFEYKRMDWVTYCAMDLVNAKRLPVVVYRQESRDTIKFRAVIRPESADAFIKDLDGCFFSIERAMDDFGMACEIVIRNDEKDAMSDMMEELADPSADSPWLRGKTRS
jgi:hypothetical protein